MRTPLALLASSALLMPAAAIATPAEAATSGVEITNCSKTRHGVTVRIKLRDNGRFTRVRVSHPRGDGNFYTPKVRRVAGGASGGGTPPPPGPDGSQLGGGQWREKYRSLPPSFRTESTAVFDTVDVSATFKLKNGKKIHLSCRVR